MKTDSVLDFVVLQRNPAWDELIEEICVWSFVAGFYADLRLIIFLSVICECVILCGFLCYLVSKMLKIIKPLRHKDHIFLVLWYIHFPRIFLQFRIP